MLQLIPSQKPVGLPDAEGCCRKASLAVDRISPVRTDASLNVSGGVWHGSLASLTIFIILDYQRSGISRKGHGRMSGCVSSLSSPLRQMMAWEGISCVTGNVVVYLASGSEFGAKVQLGGKKSVRLSGHTSRYHAVSVGD